MAILIGIGVFFLVLVALIGFILWAPLQYAGKLAITSGANTADTLAASGEQVAPAQNAGSQAASTLSLSAEEPPGVKASFRISGGWGLVGFYFGLEAGSQKQELRIFGIPCALRPASPKDKLKSPRWQEKAQGVWKAPNKKGLYRHTKELVQKLLPIIRPRKSQGVLEYGFSDPAVTGYMFGLWSIGNTFLQTDIEVIPNFQASVLHGMIELSGRFRPWSTLLPIVRYFILMRRQFGLH